MCLVQVEKAPKPLPVCATPVTAGMKFHHSDLAVTAQKGVMEFLLINHPSIARFAIRVASVSYRIWPLVTGGNASRSTKQSASCFKECQTAHFDAGDVPVYPLHPVRAVPGRRLPV